jgi:hypothetical protein
MKQKITLMHEFVEYIPNDLKNGIIYVSITFAIAAHKCCCGCGNEVITPLSPTDWKLIFDGQSITLDPSIGNWNFACQSHYWIKCNKVEWAQQWSQKEINAGRAHDALAKKKYFDNTKTAHDAIVGTVGARAVKSQESFWRKLKKWFSS